MFGGAGRDRAALPALRRDVPPRPVRFSGTVSMSVYIDSMVDYGKRIGRAGPLWCHMIGDTLEELHRMAARIGLKRAWFQADGSTPHYDIGTVGFRECAISHGAIECDRRVFVGHLQRLRVVSSAP